MQAKHVVAIGIFISSLFATLILFEWIPPLVGSFVVLGTTMTATYFIALSMLRGRRLADQEFVSRAVQRIGERKTPEEVIEQLLHWAKTTIECEYSFFFRMEGAGSQGQDMPEWREISRELADGQQSQRWPGAPIKCQPPAATRSFLALPVSYLQEVQGILYLVNRQGAGQFSALDEALVQSLVNPARMVLLHYESEEQNRRYYQQIITCLVRGAETQCPGFQGHAERVSYLAGRLGRILGFDRREAEMLKTAALLHDIGKIVPDVEVPEEELSRPGRGDEHPEKGARLFPEEESFKALREGILYHHERYNGSGFPEGLRLNEIPLTAGIIAVADVFDALTRLGEENARMDRVKAFAVIKRATGTLFDPMVVVALEELMPVLLAEEDKQPGDNPIYKNN